MSKVAIQGNASGTGTFTIAAPNSNTDRTLTLPDEAGTVLTSASDISASQLPTGSVLQVVTTVDTAQRTFNSTTFSEISTAWRLSITPISASSKLILTANFVENRGSGSLPTVHQAKFYDVTNSADVGIGASSGTRNRSTIAFRGSHADNNDVDEHTMTAVVDAESTTARTYTVYFRNEASAAMFFNVSEDDGIAFQWTAPFVFTIMEIAG